MKKILAYALVIAAFTACGGNGSDNGNMVDTTNGTGTDTSRAVPDSVTGSSGYLNSGNNANGNENAGNMHTDTLPMGAGRTNTPDSIKVKVLKQKGDTASANLKHHGEK